MYFSIVLLSEPWAYLLSLSASFITSTLNFLADFALIYLEDAISLTTLWIICLSSYSLSAGVISMCTLLLIKLYSIVLLGLYSLNDLNYSTKVNVDSPYTYLIKLITLVFFPAPSGP